jgi:hypothetical protein
MKLSTVKDFLEQTITIDELKKRISSEVAGFIQGNKKKGSSNPIYLDEDCNFLVLRQHAVLLLNFYTQNQFDENFIAYISDALLLSENVEFENEYLLETFEMLTDPEVNGKLTFLRANELLKTLT